VTWHREVERTFQRISDGTGKMLRGVPDLIDKTQSREENEGQVRALEERGNQAQAVRRAESGPGEILDHLVHVGVGQDDAVVLGPAHGLHPLTVGRARGVDILGDV